jgi:hypothetical protein
MLNCHPFKPTPKDSTPSSTWLQTARHLKYTHIAYVVQINSLDN